jgi:hypothetical protein
LVEGILNHASRGRNSHPFGFSRRTDTETLETTLCTMPAPSASIVSEFLQAPWRRPSECSPVKSPAPYAEGSSPAELSFPELEVEDWLFSPPHLQLGSLQTIVADAKWLERVEPWFCFAP